MRVLIISGEDLSGGGHRAAFRLHQALRGIGVESFMAVRSKYSDDPYVHEMPPSELGWPPVGRGYLDMLPSILSRRRDESISLGLQSANLGALVDRFKPDIVNLHWINAGIASIRAVGRLPVAVVWTLHDMWPFTGGCHYSGDCVQYRDACERCPKVKDVLGMPATTNWVYRRKQKHWDTRTLHAITPSAWMRRIALTSSLFAKANIAHVRNCVDPKVFNGGNREEMRAKLGLLPGTKAVLFSGANQPRKGGFIIPEVITLLRNTHSQSEWRFLFMGGAPPNLEPNIDIITLPRTTVEARVAGYYAASDLYALPSFEDNLPNTISESLTCGTPVAAFPTGGIVEMIKNGLNGALSSDHTAASFRDAILLATTGLGWTREAIARDAGNTYQPAMIAKDYLVFFQQAVSSAQNAHLRS